MVSRNVLFGVVIWITLIASTYQQDCMYGPNCVLPCHCQDEGTCSPTDGSCPNGCDDNWSGYGCQIGNLALNKYASMSGGDPLEAALAVNGIMDEEADQCAYGTDSTAAYWQVDLGFPSIIQRVIITNANTERFLLKDTEVEVSRTGGEEEPYENCGIIGDEGDQAQITVECESPKLARFVRLQRMAAGDASGQPTRIRVCEVRVIGYMFPGGNVAYMKPATMTDGGFDWSQKHPASQATDGQTNPNLDSNHCAYAAEQEGELAMWQVDLRQTYDITSVTIANRDIYRNYLRDTRVLVGDNDDYQVATECGRVTNEDDQVIIPCTRRGQFVFLIGTEGSDYSDRFVVCEVIVTSDSEGECPNGKWGLGCDSDCNCNQPCDVITAECPGSCRDGWTGSDCQEVAPDTDCDDGKWGENCSEDCNCKDDAVCDKTTGRCDECKQYYITPSCQRRLPHLDTETMAMSVNDSYIEVEFDTYTNDMPGEGPVFEYIIQVREYEMDEDWENATTIAHSQESPLTVNVTDLQTNKTYEFQVVPVSDYEGINYFGQPSSVSNPVPLGEGAPIPKDAASFLVAMDTFMLLIVSLFVAMTTRMNSLC